MATRLMLLILGAFHVANGLWMLAAPETWYAAVPGVAMTGPLNHHFISDVALAFLASGGGLILGATDRHWAGPAAIAGAAWPVLHALLHIWGWFAMGFPRETNVVVSEVVGVVAIGALGAVLAYLRANQKGVS